MADYVVEQYGRSLYARWLCSVCVRAGGAGGAEKEHRTAAVWSRGVTQVTAGLGTERKCRRSPYESKGLKTGAACPGRGGTPTARSGERTAAVGRPLHGRSETAAPLGIGFSCPRLQRCQGYLPPRVVASSNSAGAHPSPRIERVVLEGPRSPCRR